MRKLKELASGWWITAPELSSRYVIFRYDEKPRAHLWKKKSLKITSG
jgi:hypothetical protein